MKDRIQWIDLSKGMLITIMFWTHSAKHFTPLPTQDFYFQNSPAYLHYYTLGFVGITGISLYLLRDLLAKRQPLHKYCAQRGAKLIVVCLFIAFVFQGALFRSGNSFIQLYGSVEWALLDLLVLGRSYSHMGFVARIGLFVIVAGVLIRSDTKHTAAICSLVVIISSVFLNLYAVPWSMRNDSPELSFQYDTVRSLGYISIGAMGILLGIFLEHARNYPERLKQISVILSALLSTLAVGYTPELKDSSYGWLFHPADWFVRIVSVVSLAMLMIQFRVPDRITRWIALFGMYSLFLYVVHWNFGFLHKKIVQHTYYGAIVIDYFAQLVICFTTLILVSVVAVWLRRKGPTWDNFFKKEVGI